MPQPDRPARPVVRTLARLHAPTVGAGLAVVASVVCVFAFGLAPTALALGLLALLVVE